MRKIISLLILGIILYGVYTLFFDNAEVRGKINKELSEFKEEVQDGLIELEKETNKLTKEAEVIITDYNNSKDSINSNNQQKTIDSLNKIIEDGKTSTPEPTKHKRGYKNQ